MIYKNIKLVVAALMAIFFVVGSSAFAAGADDFIITVKTDNVGTSSDTQFTIPTVGNGYNYNVDCNGDGVNETTAETGDYTCDYGAGNAGTYTIHIEDNSGQGTGFPRIYFSNGGDRQKLTGINQWGTGHWTSMYEAFDGCSNLNNAGGWATDTPDLSGVVTLREMFSLTDTFNQDISSWDTSHVTNMDNMFHGAIAFNQPLNSWNTSNVVDMMGMFNNAIAFNQPLDSWDTSSVINMEHMFDNATAFNQPLNSWDTSNVTDMSLMFRNATAFNQPLNSWDTSNVLTMAGMFYGDIAFSQPLNSWDTSNVINMNIMFYASGFNYPLDSWNTHNVTMMSSMFENATSFNQSLDSWDTSNVTNMDNMFKGAIIFNQPLNSWDTSNVNQMSYMFYGATAFNQPLNFWDTSNVFLMNFMFYGATAFNQPLNSWNTSSVTNMGDMFNGATAFNQPLNSWNTSSVTNMGHMFYGATAFNQDVGSWNMENVTHVDNMFNGGAGLLTANYDALLNGWNAQNLPTGRSFDGGNSTYCAVTAHDNMTSTGGHNWTIVDGGAETNCNAPTDITLTNDNLDENLVDQAIGNLSVVDPDGNGVDEFYQTGRGLNACAVPGVDDSLFSINGANTLRNGIPAFDYETKNSYSICIRGVDATGFYIDKNFTIHVNDVDEATGKSGRRVSHNDEPEYTCKDSKALNFSNTGTHKQSLCKYAEKKIITSEKKSEEVIKKCELVKNTTQYLKVGLRGQEVIALQEYLVEMGINPGPVDGIFGKMTLAAVKELQTKLGTTPDGIVGPKTKLKIAASCK